jgi:DNA (cytosine-5)-methyltransferase 1
VNYYNEWDKGAAAWLRELIKQGHIPYGYVDERSIADVTPSDLEGFTQCHFFAGIGGWPYALRLAGIPDTTPLWTGSPPCQPFSVAGKQLGQLDERHLAPTFMRLVEQCKPTVLFGEQVAAAIGKHWLDDLFTELERQNYACGSAVLPACSVGAPHKRDRLFFGSVLRMGDPACFRERTDESGSDCRDGFKLERSEQRFDSQYGCANDCMADTTVFRRGEQCKVVTGGDKRGEPKIMEQRSRCGGVLNVAHADDARPQGRKGMSECSAKQPVGPGSVASGSTNQDNCFWSGADWLGCRDGKFRPVESGTFPLANGISARVGRLRGYGNAIVPQVAAEFVKAFMGSIEQ